MYVYSFLNFPYNGLTPKKLFSTSFKKKPATDDTDRPATVEANQPIQICTSTGYLFADDT